MPLSASDQNSTPREAQCLPAEGLSSDQGPIQKGVRALSPEEAQEMLSLRLKEEKPRGSHLVSPLSRTPLLGAKGPAYSGERVNCSDPNLQSGFQQAENYFLILAFKACLGNHLPHPPPPRAVGLPPPAPPNLLLWSLILSLPIQIIIIWRMTISCVCGEGKGGRGEKASILKLQKSRPSSPD